MRRVEYERGGCQGPVKKLRRPIMAAQLDTFCKLPLFLSAGPASMLSHSSAHAMTSRRRWVNNLGARRAQSVSMEPCCPSVARRDEFVGAQWTDKPYDRRLAEQFSMGTMSRAMSCPEGAEDPCQARVDPSSVWRCSLSNRVFLFRHLQSARTANSRRHNAQFLAHNAQNTPQSGY